MLVRDWIAERIGAGYVNFEHLSRALAERAEAAGIDVSAAEIRVVLERMIRDGQVETCQFLAEDQRYGRAVYDDSNIWWYWFRLHDGTRARTPATEHDT